MKNLHTLLFFTGLCMPVTTIAADNNLAIKKIFASRVSKNSPGCNLGVIKNQQLVHKAGYGLANLEMNVPLDGSQVHRMASVSKQFTAMAVLLLAEEGKVDLDADIHTYLKDLRDYGELVTIRAMLGHVSGMGDYDLIAGSYEGEKSKGSIDLQSVAGGDFRLGNEDYLTISEFYDVVKTVPLALKPNQKFQYSNLAYFLLSMLVEEVSGKSLRDYTAEKIFTPLGMSHTFFSDNPVEIIKNRAMGYAKNEAGSYINEMTNLFWVGDGGLHTNLEDMLKWDENFYTPQVGKNPSKLVRLMNTPNSDLKANKSSYANGQFVGETMGRISYSHSGGWLGTSTYYVRFPEEKMSFAMMCNDSGLDAQRLINEVIAQYLDIQ
ncbi:serine hydrolase domain-containing protein [Paraglaciecola marina]|uniref:serine hydrolase domain-containing protein n=1 Tax=Paraglaciecola marina TaxID=2500157 RepID=UPI0010607825|nr:serine hydrolase [Paraglaciecola marina]